MSQLICHVITSLFIDLDITADYVEHVAHQIHGSVRACGSTALQLHGYLLHSGVSSAHLCDVFWPIIWQMKLWIGKVCVL